MKRIFLQSIIISLAIPTAGALRGLDTDLANTVIALLSDYYRVNNNSHGNQIPGIPVKDVVKQPITGAYECMAIPPAMAKNLKRAAVRTLQQTQSQCSEKEALLQNPHCSYTTAYTVSEPTDTSRFVPPNPVKISIHNSERSPTVCDQIQIYNHYRASTIQAIALEESRGNWSRYNSIFEQLNSLPYLDQEILINPFKRLNTTEFNALCTRNWEQELGLLSQERIVQLYTLYQIDSFRNEYVLRLSNHKAFVCAVDDAMQKDPAFAQKLHALNYESLSVKEMIALRAYHVRQEEQVLKQKEYHDAYKKEEQTYKACVRLKNKVFAVLAQLQNMPTQKWHTLTANMPDSIPLDDPETLLNALSAIIEDIQQTQVPTFTLHACPHGQKDAHLGLDQPRTEIKKLQHQWKTYLYEKDQRRQLQERTQEYQEFIAICNEYDYGDGKRLERRIQVIQAINDDTIVVTRQSYTLTQETKHFLKEYKQNPSLFSACTGNQLQQLAHQECVDVLQRFVLPHNNVSLLNDQDIKHAAIALLATSCEGINHHAVAQAFDVVDFCWALLDYKAIGEGIVCGIVGAAQDLLQHPVHALACVMAGKYVLAYQLSKVVVGLADVAVTSLFDRDLGKKKFEDYCKPLIDFGKGIKAGAIKPRDCVKGASALAVGWVVQGKMLHKVGNLVNTVSSKALAYTKKNPATMPEEYMATSEGTLFDACTKLGDVINTTVSALKEKISSAVRKLLPKKDFELVDAATGTKIQQPELLMNKSDNIGDYSGSGIEKAKQIENSSIPIKNRFISSNGKFNITAALENISELCARADPALGSPQVIEEMILALKDIPGAIKCQNGEGPILKLLKALDGKGDLSNAIGAAYELEVAYNFYKSGKKIIFGEKLRNANSARDFDIVNESLAIECKAKTWERYSEIKIASTISKICEQKKIANELNKEFILFSKYEIPKYIKIQLKKNNINFLEG